MTASSPHIGTLGERSLHAALKEWYAERGDLLEREVDGYVIDIVRGDLLVEIQTANFASMKRKVADLTGEHPLRLVHPIAAEKFIVKYGPDGVTQLGRRRSPKRGSVLDLFRELVSFPHLVALDNFSVEVLLTREEEIRVNDGEGSWRRGGWSIVDQRLVEVVDRVVLASPADFRALLPPDLPDPFTTRDMADALGERVNLMGKMAFCLREMDAVEMVGRRGRAYLYSLPS
jgi:hypothetical protein